MSTGTNGRPPLEPVEGLSRYLDHEVSSLEVGARALAHACDHTVPLLRRVDLLAASARSLDEYFVFRGAPLRALAAGGHQRGRPVRARAQELMWRQADLLRHLLPALSAEGIAVCDWAHLRPSEREAMAELFAERFLPVLAPLTTDPGRALPPPASLSVCLAFKVRDADGSWCFGSVELPPVLPRMVPLGRNRFVPLEQVVLAHCADLYPGLETEGGALFRVTRQGGVQPGPQPADDLLRSIEGHLRRERHWPPVRLEIERNMPPDVTARLLAELDLGENDAYVADGMMAMAGLAGLPDLVPDRADLRARPARPALPPSLAGGSAMFDVVDRSSLLVHAPYDSYDDTVGAFLAQAARDPHVLALKQTLFRPSASGAAVKSLMRAAERGTHVVVLIELAARGGERESVACARALERAGAHVVYGLVGQRTHCSVTLAVRQQAGSVQRYSLLSTAPHDTRKAPEGLHYLTADPVVAADMADLFNFLTGYSRPERFRKLAVGPRSLRPQLLALIRREAAAGPDGRIAMKVGRLVDHEIVDALYAASQRGARVDLVVAGACALRPGVRALSPTARVVAPSGCQAEGSRFFAFGQGQERTWLITSADLTARNLDRQVDVALPVDEPGPQARLDAILEASLEAAAWALGPDGTWRRCGPGADRRLEALAAGDGAERGGGRTPGPWPAAASLGR